MILVTSHSREPGSEQLLRAMFEARKKVFVDLLKWDVPVLDGRFVFHDLRHSCASELAMAGATPLEIGAVLGHKTLAMVRRYSHLSSAHTAQLVTRVLGEKVR